MKRIIVFFGLVLSFGGLNLGVDTNALALEEIEVRNGGTLSGKITLKGEVPFPRSFPLVLYPFSAFCKDIADEEGIVELHEFEIDEDRGLKDVVVALEDVTGGKRMKPLLPTIVSRKCQFHPFVSVVQEKGLFVVVNEDPVIHNSQLYQPEKGNILLNVPIPVNSTETHPFEFEKGKRIYQMICGMHEYMQTWGFAVDNPYYAITEDNGEFRIPDIPAGTYEVVIWHPRMEILKKEVVIRPAETFSLDL